MPSTTAVGPADIRPEATDEETAAIVAALTVALAPTAAPADPPVRNSTWRFSGRWWSRPVPSRRSRPYR